MALLLLWEIDHGTQYPSGATSLSGRLMVFTKHLLEVARVDDELQGWLSARQLVRSLVAGLRPGHPLFWTVRIDPAVGEPFLGVWKAHL